MSRSTTSRPPKSPQRRAKSPAKPIPPESPAIESVMDICRETRAHLARRDITWGKSHKLSTTDLALYGLSHDPNDVVGCIVFEAVTLLELLYKHETDQGENASPVWSIVESVTRRLEVAAEISTRLGQPRADGGAS